MTSQDEMDQAVQYAMSDIGMDEEEAIEAFYNYYPVDDNNYCDDCGKIIEDFEDDYCKECWNIYLISIDEQPIE